MSPSPPRYRREPRRLNVSAAQQNSDKLQIRVVPYSPPRISGDAPPSSRAVSYVCNASPLGSPFCDRQTFEDDRPHQHNDQESWARLDVSPRLRRPSSSLTAASTNSNQDHDNVSISSRASSPRPPSSYRAKRVININPDNRTFSLLPISGSETSRSESFGSFQPSSTTPSSSWGRLSSNLFVIDDREGSPLTPLSERRSFSNSPSPSRTPTPAASSLLSASAWSHRMKGGMRKVEQTPDSKHKPRTIIQESPDLKYPSLPGPAPREDEDAHTLATKDSFQSTDSDSTMSERTNYKIYGQSSPVALSERTNYKIFGHSSPASASVCPSTPDINDILLPSEPPSSSHSNYEILGTSSDEGQSLRDGTRPETADSDNNYVLRGGPSASSSSLVTTHSQLRSEFSQESLVVPPLRPVKTKRSFGKSTVFKSRSRESLRKGSLTSLGSALTAEATRYIFAGPAKLYTRNQNPLASHPVHQWSPPLSTVMSESEGGSAPPSRSMSAFSQGDRLGSSYSRNLLSMSSSLAGIDGQISSSHSRNGSLERPPATFNRNAIRDISGNYHTIRDHDEDGDGLADLHHRPSRTRLRLGSFVSGNSSESILRSSGSTRSLNPFAFPGWARLYYGSGERRFVIAQASTDSMRSMYNSSLYNQDAPLPPATTQLNRTTSHEKFTRSASNRTARNRLREISQAESNGDEATDFVPESIEIPNRVASVIRRIRKQTSSIWSPHLGRDRRAKRYSHWEPPMPVWSTDNGFDWKRNLQVILFVVGFMIPFGKTPHLCNKSQGC